MSETRRESEIRAEIAQLKIAQALTNEPGKRRLEARIQECARELRAVDDTPVIPYRPPSVPPSVPRGRRPESRPLPPPLPPRRAS